MILSVDGVSFSYGEGTILDDVSFRVRKGEVLSILGCNGAGKTTLLKNICGLLRPSAGEIKVGDDSLLKLSGREMAKRVAFVPQSVPPSRMTVFDSVLLGRRPYIELSATEKDLDTTSEAIEALGLSDLSLRYTTQLSGGEFQKVQIARALVQEPRLLVLDEPSNNLDINNQHITMNMVEEAVRSRDMCTIMTMHDINLAIHYSDRFLFIANGGVAAFGGPEVIDEELIKDVYGINADVIDHRGVPLVVPRESRRYNGGCCHSH